MDASPSASPRSPNLRITAAAIVVLFVFAGCGKDDPVKPVTPDGGGGPSTQLTGSFLNSSEAGLLTVDIATANLAPSTRPARPDTAVAATGVASPDGGGAVVLSGTYKNATDSLKLSGQGYVFNGYHWATAVPPHVEGYYSGPNGSGIFGCMPGTRSTVKVFCGHFQSGSTPTSGRWNIVIAGGDLMGSESPTGDPGVVGFSGTVTGTGTVRALAFSTGGDFFLAGIGSWNTTTNHVTGTWATADDAGTWSADLCLPSGTGPN